MIKFLGLCFLFMILLTGCGERVGMAPVVESKWRALNPNATQHLVMRGETLYAIAFRYDQDYRHLAAINHLSSPYTVRVGQVLRLQPGVNLYSRRVGYQYQRPVTRTTPSATSVKVAQYSSHAGWRWPASGRIMSSYAPLLGRKGIDIAGKKGDKIYASRSGVVAYSGNGLVGYGNLIIIKHDQQYLTAYGNNLRNLVKEGQVVRAGQVIGQMGVVARRYWGVHFEIRHAGKPINPMGYLQKG